MGRFVALLGMATAALLLTSSAEAAVGMCADPTARIPAELQGIVQAAVQAARTAESASGEDVREGTLIAVSEVPTPRALLSEWPDDGDFQAGDPAPAEDAPWCSSPDDPRCTPIGGGTPTGSVEGRVPITVVPGVQLARAPPGAEQPFHARDGLTPTAGVESRVERPPR